ncbi:MAG TPA: cupredoxin domain-containing protein [Allosphingosinicella sp.]|nr:cupredoxin domain-containing protein [Allosphingosinicella sp.]
MRHLLLAFVLLTGPSVAAHAEPTARTIEVRLTSFDFTPGTIRLRAGEPVVLRLVNASGGGHNFVAPQLFASARDVSGPVQNGRVELAGRQTVEVRLTPARGTYRLRCTHTLHSTFGMTGRIVVR